MKHPLLVGGGILAGLFVAWEVWGRSPGDKAQIGDVVRVDVKDLQSAAALTTLLGGVGTFPAGTFVYLLVTNIEPGTGKISGVVKRVQLTDRAIQVERLQVIVSTFRKNVLPLKYGAPAVPTTVV